MFIGTRLPAKRTRYNEKRRQKDMDMIFSQWNIISKDKVDSKIHITDVPTKVAKKYKRAITVHAKSWTMKDTAVIEKFEKLQLAGCNEEASKLLRSHSQYMLDTMDKVLPTYNSKRIIDIPMNFRERYDDWDVADKKGVTILRYWNNYRIASGSTDAQSTQYIDEALSLVPPLKRGEMPHKCEVMARVIRAKDYVNSGDIDISLQECRVCLAAIRLLDHFGKVDMTDMNDILISKTNNWAHTIIRLTVEKKIRDNASRPYMLADERLDLMKELGIGMYHASRLKCNFCKKTSFEVKLSTCSGCRKVWYCGKECAKKAWSNGHKESCDPGSDLIKPLRLPLPMMKQALEEVSTHGGTFCMDGHDVRIVPIILCKDFSTGKIFDVLYDEDVDIEEAPTPTREEAAIMAKEVMISKASDYGMSEEDMKSMIDGMSEEDMKSMIDIVGDDLEEMNL